MLPRIMKIGEKIEHRTCNNLVSDGAKLKLAPCIDDYNEAKN